MGKYCTLCRAEAIKGGTERSFHRFPAPQYLRKKWCQILNKDINKLNTWTFVCSDHFSPECFIYRSNGQRFLNDDAVPHPFTGKVYFKEQKKRGAKKLKAKIEQVTIKTEYEDQELLNPNLSREIKVEDVDVSQVCKEIIKTEPESDNVLIKTEDITVKCEPPGDEVFDTTPLDDVDEVESGGIYETSDMDNKVEAESKDSLGTSELNNEVEAETNEIITQALMDTEMIRKFSKEKDDDILPRIFKFTYPKLRTDDGVYSCVECSFSTPEHSVIRRHFLGHRNSEYKKHPEIYKELYKSYHCKQCDYVTIQRYNLSRHMVKHLPKDGKAVKTYVCDQCEYSTKYRCDIVKHRIKHVPTGHRFICTKCSYEAYEEDNLREHMEKGHVPNKVYKYECEHCPFKTDSKSGLSRHVRASHSGNRPYKYDCKYCSFKNDSKWSLNRHTKLCHKGAELNSAVLS